MKIKIVNIIIVSQFIVFSFVSITSLFIINIYAIIGGTKSGMVITYWNRSNEMIIEFWLFIIMEIICIYSSIIIFQFLFWYFKNKKVISYILNNSKEILD